MPSKFKFVQPRPTIEIHLPEEKVLSGPRGATVGEFLRAAYPDAPAPVMGAIVNGELRELTFVLQLDSRVVPVTMAEEDGMRIYRRSLTFILEAAFAEMFPSAQLTIDHSVAAGGYFCQVRGLEPLTDEDLAAVEARMRAWIAQDLPFKKEQVPLETAIDYFRARGYEDKVRLLAHHRKDYLIFYTLGSHSDYHHGYMAPSTGYIRWFALQRVNGGFTLRFPRRERPTSLGPQPEYPKMLAAFRAYGDLLERLGISSGGALNDAIVAGRIQEVILVSEALHEQRLAEIAAQIERRREEIKVVLISGPSSSGKTTSSRRLTVQLLARGISPYPLELDNYFVSREHTPVDEHGALDYESLYALDLELLNSHLKQLIAGEEVHLPRYNFFTGEVEPGERVHLEPGQILIMEGIHGLNPGLIPQIPVEQTFRVYISALTQLNLDRHNRVSTTDTRLVRRIVRDARERGYNAQMTINRWESVVRGEKRNIFPYQENADIIFNSALVYELAALKPLAEPLLRQVPFGAPEYIEAKRLLALLEWFLPLDAALVPEISILKEFLGGSSLQHFRLWNTHKPEPPGGK